MSFPLFSKSKFLFAFAVSATALTTLPAGALTLDEAVGTVSTNSHDLKEMRLQLEASRLAEVRAFAANLPRLEFSANHLFTEKFQELELAFGGSNVVIPAIQPYTTIGVGASLEVFGGFRSTNSVRAARLGFEANQHRLQRVEQQTHAEIRTLFYQALGSQVLVDVADQNIQTLENHMKDVNSRVRGGLSTRFDTLRVEVQLEDARTEKLSAQNRVITARARLFQALGVADDGKALIGQLPEDFSHYDVTKLTAKESVREDRAAQLKEIERSSALMKVANSHWYPNVRLFAAQDWYNNYNHAIFESEERFKSAYSVGLQLKWNLYDGGASVADEQLAVLERQIANERLGRLDESVPVDIEDSKNRLAYDVATYKAKLSSVHKAEEAVRLAKGALRAGALTNTEVLDVVLDLNRAKAAAVKSQIDAVDAIGKLEMALGHTI